MKIPLSGALQAVASVLPPDPTTQPIQSKEIIFQLVPGLATAVRHTQIATQLPAIFMLESFNVPSCSFLPVDGSGRSIFFSAPPLNEHQTALHSAPPAADMLIGITVSIDEYLNRFRLINRIITFE